MSGALLAHRVEASPDETFIKWRGTDYTYAQIDGMANSVANSLLGWEQDSVIVPEY